MRKIKKKSTSPFQGVSSHQNRWIAQYHKVQFFQRFHSEMEAVSHLMAVYAAANLKNQVALRKIYMRNPPGLGREKPEAPNHIDKKTGSFLIPIDWRNRVKLYQRHYDKYLQDYWFIRGGRPCRADACIIQEAEPRFVFFYDYLDDLIYKEKAARQGLPFEPGEFIPFRLDGDFNNLREDNLVDPRAVRVEGQSLGVNPLRMMNSPQQRLEITKWDKQMKSFQDYKVAMGPGGSGHWIGPIPTDPRREK